MTRVSLAMGLFIAVTILASPLLGGQLPTLQGDWDILAMSKNNNEAPPEAVKEAFIRATATTFVAIVRSTGAEAPDSKHSYEFINKNEINFYETKIQKGKSESESAPVRVLKPGIYEFFRDGTLKICFSEDIPGLKDPSGKILVPEKKLGRPTDFKGGLGQFSITLKRKAK